MSETRYPLCWPVGTPRTAPAKRKRSAFGQRVWGRSLGEMKAQLRGLGVPSFTLSTNQMLRNDGMPFAQERRIDDPGVALYFPLNGERVCFPCDRWLTIAENLRAITLHLEAMRGMERWGVGRANQAFTGYKALTAVAGEGEDCWLVLGIERGATVDQIRAAHRALAVKAHPDAGGSSDQMSRINTARDRALAEKERG